MVEANMQFNDIYQALTEMTSLKNNQNKPKNKIGYLANKNDDE